MVEREVDPSNPSMTVRSLTHLLDVGATTTAMSRRLHVRKLPEGPCVVNLLFRQRTSRLHRLRVYRPGRCSNIDPILQVMLASNHGVSPPSLLSLRSTFLWVSRAIFRYS